MIFIDIRWILDLETNPKFSKKFTRYDQNISKEIEIEKNYFSTDSHNEDGEENKLIPWD